ncbi:MAG: translocation/assembly module TamB domain-containing protein, partial [Deinococcales bacterium]|nr:translocation/assembly module TamB domain-containing protein [Chitinophagaceae bacterium]
MKRFFKIFGRTILIIIAFILVIVIAIQTSIVQNWAVGFATKKLSKSLNTEVRIKKVGFSLFDKVNFEGILIRDKQKDTLLYAQQMRIRITDWFFLKDKIDLKFIGLEDAVIKLQRSDSTWNYKFIAAYFSKKDNKKDTTKGVEINLKKVDLKNVALIQNDLWNGERMTINMGSLLLDAEDFNFNNNTYKINSILAEKPFVSLQHFKALMPVILIPKIIVPKKDTSLRFNLGINFTINNLNINNGTFISESLDTKALQGFDGSHLQLTQLKGSFKDFSFLNDTLKANIDISCKERCGFELKKLKTKLKVTPQIIELAKLDLQTNRSRLGDYYAMRFAHFNDDFANFTSKVFLDANFKNTSLFSDDIAYFVPDLKTWKKQAVVSGNFLGTIADFTLKNFFIRSGVTTNIAGNLAMKGLPDIDKTVINFNNGYIKTNNVDLAIVIPALKKMTNPNVASLGNILFRGNFNGTINNFKTVGVISTNIGSVDANLAMKFPKRGEPSYVGSLITNRFNLGKFINSTALGLVNFAGKIDGSSFDINTINASLDGKFSLLEFNGYAYTNIATNGSFLKKYFNGELKIDDPNIDFTSTIEIDFSLPKPRINILGDLVKSNLQNIKLTSEKYELTGLFDLNFIGLNIDEFEGTAKILNANLTHLNDKLSFDSLVLTASDSNGIRTLTAKSNEFSASVTGSQYRLLDLPVAFQTYLHHYYPAYFNQPVAVLKDQDFSVTFDTKEFDKYAKIIDSRISGFNYASLSGSINTSKNLFSIVANIPNVSFDKYHIYDASLKGEGTLDTLILNGDITTIAIGDSLTFPNTKIAITSSNNHSIVSLKTRASNTINEANLNADLYTLEDGVRINFRPSSFVLNNKKWDLEKQGEIVVRKNFVSAENVKFSQGFQEIKVETELSSDNNSNNLVLKLKNVVLGDLAALVIKSPRLEGIGNGEIRLNDFYGDFNAEVNLQADQFRMDNDSIGVVTIKSSYDNKTGKIPFNIQSNNQDYTFSTQGFYNTKDSTGDALYINTNLNDTKIAVLERFLGDIFSNLSGKATGNLIVSGNPANLNLLGKVVLRKGGLKVNFTQVYYEIDSANINFQPDGIDFGEITIRDKYKNTARLRGKLYEKNFKDMAFDFNMQTDKLLLIDTKQKDNKQFYGKAIGKATLSLKGPEYAAKMTIVAEANDSSHIYIPSSVSRQSGEADFIVFKQYGTEFSSEAKKSNFDLTVDLDITANNKVDIDVILDELTGDIVKARGNGRLRILAGTTEPLTIKGRYNINFGRYDFNFQSFIRKPFDMLNADNYIEWNGDPYNAEVRIDAVYKAERVSVSELLSNQQVTNVSSATKSYRGDVYVVAHLRDKLTKPTITFSLDFPQNSPIKNDTYFSEFISRV